MFRQCICHNLILMICFFTTLSRFTCCWTVLIVSPATWLLICSEQSDKTETVGCCKKYKCQSFSKVTLTLHTSLSTKCTNCTLCTLTDWSVQSSSTFRYLSQDYSTGKLVLDMICEENVMNPICWSVFFQFCSVLSLYTPPEWSAPASQALSNTAFKLLFHWTLLTLQTTAKTDNWFKEARVGFSLRIEWDHLVAKLL